jgi:NAD-dependent dihydropyrimidine dehydrogenase PreA subunit
MSLLNSLRRKIPWFPTIDIEACRADLQCLNFCPHDVFEWDPNSGRPIVAHPLRCLPGCQICLEGCTTGAISLPTKDEFHANLKRLRATGDKAPYSPQS